MDATLQKLFEFDGMQGAMITTPGGQIIRKKTHAIFDNATLSAAATTVAKALESLQVHHEDWDNLVVHFAEGKAMIKRIGDQHLLHVIADNSVNLTFASVAINVAHKRLLSLMEKGQLQAPPAPAAAPPPPAPKAATNTTSWGEVSMTMDVKSFLEACRSAMAQSVGPMAKVLVKEEVVNLARGSQFTNEQLPHLVSALEAKLATPEDVAAFRKRMGV